MAGKERLGFVTRDADLTVPTVLSGEQFTFLVQEAGKSRVLAKDVLGDRA